eukprot:gene13706-13828_t
MAMMQADLEILQQLLAKVTAQEPAQSSTADEQQPPAGQQVDSLTPRLRSTMGKLEAVRRQAAVSFARADLFRHLAVGTAASARTRAAAEAALLEASTWWFRSSGMSLLVAPILHAALQVPAAPLPDSLDGLPEEIGAQVTLWGAAGIICAFGSALVWLSSLMVVYLW